MLLNLIIDIGGTIWSWILQDTEQGFNVPVWKVAWYVTTNQLDGPAWLWKNMFHHLTCCPIMLLVATGRDLFFSVFLHSCTTLGWEPAGFLCCHKSCCDQWGRIFYPTCWVACYWYVKERVGRQTWSFQDCSIYVNIPHLHFLFQLSIKCNLLLFTGGRKRQTMNSMYWAILCALLLFCWSWGKHESVGLNSLAWPPVHVVQVAPVQSCCWPFQESNFLKSNQVGALDWCSLENC